MITVYRSDCFFAAGPYAVYIPINYPDDVCELAAFGIYIVSDNNLGQSPSHCPCLDLLQGAIKYPAITVFAMCHAYHRKETVRVEGLA